ncbi:hypothetical protein D9754_13230 [Planomicrobium sp. Y74]|nr:hypothetical protein D9754_13230 [Planomicrobium sp. Y74]
MESILINLESISAVPDSISLIWKFSLLENEKSTARRGKSYPKSRILPEFVIRNRQSHQSTTIFTVKQTKSPLKPDPTSKSPDKTAPKTKEREWKSLRRQRRLLSNPGILRAVKSFRLKGLIFSLE